MSFAKIRLFLAALMFVGWIGYLAYLALNFAHPVVVSRSQWMAAEFPVIAEIEVDASGKANPAATLVESLRKGELPAKLNVSNLADLEYPEKRPPHSGRHLLLLMRTEGNSFKVVPTPPSPGDHGGKFYIYPWTPEVEKQAVKLLAD